MTSGARAERGVVSAGERVDDVFAGAGETAALARALDWAATDLGPVDGWPLALRAAVRLVLASPVGMSLSCGPAYTLVYNDAYRHVLGTRHPAALGRPAGEVCAEIWGGIAPLFEQVRSGGPPVSGAHVPFVVTSADGDTVERWFDDALSPVRDDDGTVLAVLGVAADTTAGGEQRVTRLLDSSPAVMAIYSGPDHVVTYVNPSWGRVVGKPGALGRPFREVFPEMADTTLSERLRHVYETGEPYAVTEQLLPLRRRPGGPLEDSYWDFVWQPQPAGDGRSGLGTDILLHAIEVTAHVRARREAEAAGTRAEAVLASIADAFYLLDRDWRITYVNAAAEPLLQTTRAALLGRTLWEAFPGVKGSVFEGPYREAMATGRVTSVEAYFDPLATWFDVRTYPWAGGLMVHFRDIGARKAAEAEREQLLADAQAARREAETANRAKAEFLAVMSHELRTPLNAIGGYAELLELGIRGAVTPEQRADLHRIQQSQRHLLGLVNEVLNYARIETGTVHYDVIEVPLAAVVAAVEPLVAPQLAAKGLAFTTRVGEPTPVARADEEKLRQVLLNLLSNAIKFTAQGGRVEVRCEVAGDRVAVRVADTGIGIAPEELERVFEPFVQVNSSFTRTHEGTGLGLAISRDLAQGMGGDLTATSSPGRGSTFTLTLPRAR